MSDQRKFTGVTCEGHSFEMVATYEPGAPDGAPALCVLGVYGADDDGEDGPGKFRIERGADGLYYREGYLEGRKIPEDLFPCVICDGEILKITAI